MLLSSLNLLSQHRVTGEVITSNNSNLELANVIVFNTKGTIITGTTTNEKGFFELILERDVKCKIVISYIGFKNWEKEINLEQDINLGKISLKETNSLDEITITARKKIITNQGDKTIFNINNSSLKNGYETMELLKVTPYVWVDMNDNILINGEKATILINGRKRSDIQNYLSTIISSEDIKQIEVQTNQSANSDANTTGGIINIILDEKEKGFRSNLNTSYTLKNKAYNSYSNINFDYGTDKWNIYSSYGFGVYDFFAETINTVHFLEQKNKINTNTEKNSLSNNHNYTIGFINKINENHQIGLELYGRNHKGDYSRLGKANYYTNNNLIDNGTIDVYENPKSKSINALLDYKWKLSDNDNMEAYFEYYNNKSDNLSTSKTIYNNTSNNNENRYNSNSKTEIIVFQIDYNKEFKNKTNLDFGIKHTDTDRFNNLLSEFKEGSAFIENNNQTTDINYKERISAIYISADKKFKENNYLKLGIRAENTKINKVDFRTDKHFKKNYIDFFPSFYYSRTITDNKFTSLSYSRSLRRPHFGLLNDDIEKVNDFQYYVGNPNLNPEFTDKYELKYTYNKHYFSAYYKNTKDKITSIYSIEDDIAYHKTINLGSDRKFGIGYRTTKKIKKWWLINISYQIYNSRYIDKNNKASFINTSYGVRLSNNFKINKTTKIDFSGFYGSPSTSSFYQAHEIYSANLSFKKSFLNRKLNLSIYVNDIFNTLSFKNLREFETFNAYYERKPNRRSIRFKLVYNISNNKKVNTEKNKSKNDVKRRI